MKSRTTIILSNTFIFHVRDKTPRRVSDVLQNMLRPANIELLIQWKIKNIFFIILPADNTYQQTKYSNQLESQMFCEQKIDFKYMQQFAAHDALYPFCLFLLMLLC
jgi:hypothetical protein